jgi:hypothetical protein
MRAMTARISGRSCDDGGFNLLYPAGNGPTAAVSLARPPETHEVSKFRWKVERSHGWLDNWRRLVTRYDWYTQSYAAFLTIACFMTVLSRILEWQILGLVLRLP